ncbi:MAG TPA: hypothetical protein V6C81_25200 [Planktothrix sp.]
MFESVPAQENTSRNFSVPDLLHRVVDDVKREPVQSIGAGALVVLSALALVANKGRFCSMAERELPVFEGIGRLESNGKLAPGVYNSTFEELAQRFGTTEHRQHLLDGLQAFAHNVGRAGCEEIRIGGSFVTASKRPSDFDALWKFSSSVDQGKLDWTLLTDSRLDSRCKFGGDIFSTRTKKLDFGIIFPKHKPISRWLTEDARGLRGVVSIDPRTIPEPTQFKPFTYDVRL